MRVLLAFEEEYRAYLGAMATAIREFRSEVEVAIVDGGRLEAEVESFDPQLVITSPPIPENPVDEQLIALIELSPDTQQPSRFRVGEKHWEITTPLGETLSVIDEAKRLLRTSRDQEPPTLPRCRELGLYRGVG